MLNVYFCVIRQDHGCQQTEADVDKLVDFCIVVSCRKLRLWPKPSILSLIRNKHTIKHLISICL